MKTSSQLDRLLAEATADADVLAVLRFGSTARGDGAPGSDVDVCLVLDPEAGVDASEKRLHYLSRFDLDVHVFQQLPLHIRSRVLKEGEVLHVTDEDALYALAARTAKAFELFRPYYTRYLESVLRAGS